MSNLDLNRLHMDALADPQRLDSLRRRRLLDTPADPAFDRLTRLAARVLQTPIALVNLVDEQRQFFKSQFGLEEPLASMRSTSLDYSYCQYVVAAKLPLIIEDARVDPLVSRSRLTLEFGVAAYAGVPLITSSGDVLGAFSVFDKQPRRWSDDDIQTLTDLAQSVMTEIELRSQLIEQQNTEEALRRSEQHLEAVINSAPLIMFVIDRDGVFQMSAGRALETLGYERDRIVGQKVWDAYANYPHFLQGLRRALEGTPSTVLLTLPAPSGEAHYETYLSPMYAPDGSISSAIGVATDMTERVIAENTLEQLVEKLTILRRIEVELSETLDLNSVLTIAMDTALRATGAEHGFIGLFEGDALRVVQAAGAYVRDSTYDTRRGIIGRALRTLEPQFAPHVTDDPDFISDIPGVRAQITIPLVHRDHLVGALNLKTTRSKVFTPEAFDFLTLIAGQITIAVDNAQLYQVSQQQLEELHHLYMRVSELEQLKTDMIRIAAHDLRNPLGIVNGYAEMLLEDADSLTLDQRDFIEAIHASGDKMFKIIDDILSLQRIESSSIGEASSEINLVELARAVFDSNSTRAHQKGQSYHLFVPDAPIYVRADPAQMREAMDNLISNAIKYTPLGGTISVSVEMREQPRRAHFQVEDSGVGIPEDQQVRLFQPFFRASNARASQIEGTGLGLHLVKNIIDRQGGQMRFESVVDQGSTFGFDLPTVDVEP